MLDQCETSAALHRARFGGEVNLLASISADQQLSRFMEQARRRGGSHVVRRNLLATAVRVDPRLLPNLTRLTDDVVRRAEIDAPLEFYVFASPEINACVTRGKTHLLVMLSSAAIERLTSEELEFVVGHELGHALYGHLDMPVSLALNSGADLPQREAMRLLAWQRKAEISADRAGLVCCGSLDTAATAMFKLLSGLAIDGLEVNPHEFADQWDDLAREVSISEGEGAWGMTHPFPTLRMKALIHYWNTTQAGELIDRSSGDGCVNKADQRVESLLALMDPLAREQQGVADPMLAGFFLWGGLTIAAGAGDADVVIAGVRELAGDGPVELALESGPGDAGARHERFEAELKARRKALSAKELHRLLTGLARVAAAAPSDAGAAETLRRLAGACGVDPGFVDNAVRQAA